MKTLHPHQNELICMLRDSFKRGKRRPMAAAPTGFGKTLTAAAIIKNALAKNPKARILFCVDAISLVWQTQEKFREEGIYDVGIIQADNEYTDYSKQVQIASVQTLERRGMPYLFDLAINDEAHCLNRWLVKTMALPEYEDMVWMGLSATPWTKGLGHIYDDLLIPCSLEYLIDTVNPHTGKTYLKPFRVFAASHPNMKGVKVQAGEYQDKATSAVMSEDPLVADVIDTWLKRSERRATIVFCVDRAHAKKTQQRFKDAHVNCGYIDAFTPADERKEIERLLHDGTMPAVCNVGVLVKGIDWDIGCISDAAPNHGEMRFVQKFGRGLRPSDRYPDLIYLDHASNTVRLGFPTDILVDELDRSKPTEKQKPIKKEALPKECPFCTFLKPPKVRECPACHKTPEVRSEISEADGELVEIGKGKKQPTMFEKQEWYSGLLSICEAKGYKGGWVANQYRAKFGVWPKGMQDSPNKPTPELQSWLLSRRIAYQKATQGKQRRAA